ncbi:MAG: hypothetical protein C4576_15495 [Desulfobacteraceae bacterium]|nr:MAG: hypothetical protein C4576_15495 [Desulfobacteraceae bacterium]
MVPGKLVDLLKQIQAKESWCAIVLSIASGSADSRINIGRDDGRGRIADVQDDFCVIEFRHAVMIINISQIIYIDIGKVQFDDLVKGR